MDKKNTKKSDPIKTEKDRGDNLKKTVKKPTDTDRVKTTHPGGDSDRRINKGTDKPKVIIFKKFEEKHKSNTDSSKENVSRKTELETELAKPVKEDRRGIREKYTLKFKNSPVLPNAVKKDEVTKGNVKLPIAEIKNEHPLKKKLEQKEKNDSSIGSRQSENQKTVHRKPIIKTITAKNDHTKVYKAVTFVDQKKVKPTSLQIKIPSDVKNVNANNLKTETSSVKKVKTDDDSKVSLKDVRKNIDKKKRYKRSHALSPDLEQRVRSPPTEVAKWAPCSINRHTKPYYEAWVNTTLAAISKSSRKDKLFLEKQSILQSFQRALAERPETPELIYENCTDERYTGRIKVKQRS